MAVDAKYGKVTVARAPGNPLGDEEPVFILRGRDALAPKAIVAYLKLCAMESCDRDHLDNILDAKERIDRFQEANPDLVKQPD